MSVQSSPDSTPHSAEAVSLLKRHGQTLEAFFRRFLDRHTAAPLRLREAIEYSLLAGGKRLRPALVLECAAVCAGRRGTDHDPYPTALIAAAALELIHTFSLVHDDLPSMDDDDLRRGRPTNHKVFGEAMAVLAGDAMVTMAFGLLADVAEPGVAVRLVQELAAASGPEGMIGGQVLDIESENKPLSLQELQRLHRMKTGALLTVACRLGAIAAGADEGTIGLFSDFGRHLGLAFQVVDDLLDETATPEQLGKATHKDKAKGKNTYPSLLGIEPSRQAAKEQLEAALQKVQPFGEAAAGLVALARFVVEREL